MNHAPPSSQPTASAIAIVTSLLLSAIALVSFQDGGYQWYIAVTAIATFVICAVVFAARRSGRVHAAEARGAAAANADDALDSAATTAMQQRVLAFAVEMRGSLANERLHEVIARELPPLLGVDQMWIEIELGRRRQLIAQSRGSDGTPTHPLMLAPGEWATFPLPAADTVVGVLGVPIMYRPLAPGAKGALAALAPLIGDSLHTAHTIAHLRELSTVDLMTGCSTRQDGLARLSAELKRAHRASQQVAILMLDLDYFKSVNDRYGHQCGDAVLAAVGRTIMQTLRVSDLRCRWGGEEFLVALPESSLDAATRVAVTLARRIATTVTEYESARIQLTASVGVTIAMPGEEDPDPVLGRADAALYKAKAEGRNCIRVLLADGEIFPPRDAPTAANVTAAGTPPANALTPATSTAMQQLLERRDPRRSDRREHAGPGRRTGDPIPPLDEAQVRASPV